MFDEARQPQRHTASPADGASGLHPGQPARTRHQDRVAARVDRAGVVSQYRSGDRHFAEPDIDRSGWTEHGSDDCIGAAHGASPGSSPLTLDRVAANPLPTRSPDRPIDRSPRPTRQPASSSARRPKAELPAASSTPRAEPDAPLTTEAANPVDATPAAEAGAEPAAGQPIPGVTPISLEQSDVRPEPRRSPWAAAAAGGKALGRQSRDASVATAGFFSRFGRRVAGAF